MANDLTLQARRAILATLKADGDLVAIVPAASIYPQSPPALPAFPFIRYGSPTAVPLRAGCIEGTALTVAIHAFSKGREASGSLLESAEDHAARIGAAIASALTRRTIAVPAIGKLRVRWASSQILTDDEAGAYHAVVNIRARFLA